MADIATRSARPEKRRSGFVVVFTSDGKGEATAAMGLALRAHGNRMRVRIIQFIKGTWKTGEVESLRALALAMHLIDDACRLLREMATFGKAGVSGPADA